MTAIPIILYALICWTVALILLSSKKVMKKVPRVKKRVVESFTLAAKLGCLFAILTVMWEVVTINSGN